MREGVGDAATFVITMGCAAMASRVARTERKWKILNLLRVVPEVGLEPTRPKATDFESVSSTSSDTLARSPAASITGGAAVADTLGDFDYRLPERLIARYPLADRSASRLLCLDSGSGYVAHRIFRDLPELLHPGDLLVMNDTRVIPARLHALKRGTKGRVEILVERVLSESELRVQLKSSRSPRPGTVLTLCESADDSPSLEVLGREDGFYRLRVIGVPTALLLERFGTTPLPPYIEREPEDLDRERYQTVYARKSGAVAAPTAGLHFDDDLLRRLDQRGIRRAWVTLHVGAGTFQPVRSARVEEHRMHREYMEVTQAVCDLVRQTQCAGRQVIAVGTTSVRCLESAAAGKRLQPMRGDTGIFIYPPYRFRVVDAMITNFHLPRSTLLMLVSAFAGRETILATYQEAIQREYRFFSYGDAMLITGKTPSLTRSQASR